jgi:hypothetical protein
MSPGVLLVGLFANGKARHLAAREVLVDELFGAGGG